MSRIVVIDTETTGLDPYVGNNRIIELAAIEILDGEISGNSFHSFINPEGKESNRKAFEVHQIRDEFLIDKDTFKDVADEFLAFIDGAELCAYNAVFDFKFLQAEVNKAGKDLVFSRDFHMSCLMADIKEKLKIRQWLALDKACIRY